jgi:hypothetical protein
LPFHVHFTDDDRACLAGLPLSDRAKEKVEEFIEYAIANVDDVFRQDPANRTHPNPAYFQRHLLIYDVWGDRRFHRIDFVLNDANAAYGVLIVVYVDHQ